MKLPIEKLRDHKVSDNVLSLHTNMDADHGGRSYRFQRYKELTLK